MTRAVAVHEQSWETFSRNRHVDTRHAFHWIRAALRHPLAPDSLVVAMSSGAADIAAYARRRGIDIATFATALEPLLMPAIVCAEIARLRRDTGNRDELQVYELTGHGLHALA